MMRHDSMRACYGPAPYKIQAWTPKPWALRSPGDRAIVAAMKDLTKVVHHPPVDQDGFTSLAVPTYRASTIVFDSADAYAQRKRRGASGYAYGLHGTPTTRTLESQLSALEGAAGTIILPSGQAGIALIFLTVLQPGDTVLVPANIYPPALDLCRDILAPLGIGHRVYDPTIGAGIAALIDPDCRLIWTESPGSATMEVGDLPAIVAAARDRGVLTGCDNSWATPLLFKPLAIGMDFAMEAITKYIGGHSDLLLGSVSVRDPAWDARLRERAHMLGIGVSPDDCTIALRGIETLGVRLGHIGRVALDFARWLADHPAVERVLHPALPDCPGHVFWKRDFKGASGVFSVVFAPEREALLDEALTHMRSFVIGASWGGTRSLLAPMTMPADRLGGPPGRSRRLLRISIGLEDQDDLRSDLEGLLDRLAGSAAAG